MMNCSYINGNIVVQGNAILAFQRHDCDVVIVCMRVSAPNQMKRAYVEQESLPNRVNRLSERIMKELPLDLEQHSYSLSIEK